ncbi:SixA phosphatase family protein [Planctomicrobium sp. SH661]|uniref:SixA phosphatase family protein n=1 Tax=Planctomicrobium sp. SH661 TaxID=3448124 RepID=UPI003F5BAA9C
MRHAKSAWDQPELDDHDRILKKRGMKAARRMAAEFRKRDVTPARIISSSATRALETARIVANEFGLDDIDVKPSLYHAPVTVWKQLLASLPSDKTTLIVGHNPGLEELLCELTCRAEHFPTAAAAYFEVTSGAETFAPGSLQFITLVRPKDLQDETS